MKITFASQAWEDYLWWQVQDRRILRRINALVADIARNGNEGIGRPEPLKHGFQGYWSRRINDEHRLIGPDRPVPLPLRELSRRRGP